MLGLNSRRLGLSFMLLGAVAVAGCGSDGATTKPDSGADKPADMRGSGGQVGTGGQFGTGGQLGTGGSLGTGGALDTGGAPGTGGTAGTGGAIGTGGNVATGGTTTGGAGGSPSGGAGGTRTGGAGGTGGMGTGGMGTGGAGGAGTSCTSAATCPAPAGGNGMAVCNGSICGVVCNNGYHRCGNVCALNNSPLTCGTTAAAAACTPCAVPTNGTATCDGTPLACGVNCTTGYHACGSACIVNGSTSIASCGNSCTVCTAPTNGTVTCSAAGTCVHACSTGFHLCGNACVANNSVASGCTMNGCTACAAPTNGSVLCNASNACVPSCNTGFHLCGTTCVPNNSTTVTSCGNSCTVCTDPSNGGPTCTGTPPTCGITCSAGFHGCPTANPSMCAPNNNVNSCGASCAPCAARPNATVACTGGACVYDCVAGRHMCGTTCVLNDADATCGTADGACSPCGTGLTCSSAGVCEPSMCAAGTHRCGTVTTGSCQPNASTTMCGNGNGTCVDCPAPTPANTHAVCTNGACGSACNTAFCPTSPTAACVSNTLPTSCGGNCAVCPAPTGTVPHGVASCNIPVAGADPVCDFACATGYHKCGAACVADNDVAHCGTSCDACNVTLPTNAPAQACEATPPSTALACTFTCTVGANAASSYHRCGNACVVNSKYCPGAANPCTPCTGSQVCNPGGTACIDPPA